MHKRPRIHSNIDKLDQTERFNAQTPGSSFIWALNLEAESTVPVEKAHRLVSDLTADSQNAEAVGLGSVLASLDTQLKQ